MNLACGLFKCRSRPIRDQHVFLSQMFDEREISVFAASFTVVAALFLLRRFRQNGVKYDGKRYPPSISVLPLWGAIVRGGFSVLPQYLMKASEEHGPVFCFTIGKRWETHRRWRFFLIPWFSGSSPLSWRDTYHVHGHNRRCQHHFNDWHIYMH